MQTMNNLAPGRYPRCAAAEAVIRRNSGERCVGAHGCAPLFDVEGLRFGADRPYAMRKGIVLGRTAVRPYGPSPVKRHSYVSCILGKVMKFDPEKYHRRSIRLKGYDYRQAGAYFITLVTYERACLFGEILDGIMHVSPFGQIVQQEWLRSAELRHEIELDTFVVMPNHIHAVVSMNDGGAHSRAPLPDDVVQRDPRSLGSLVACYKATTTKRINDSRDMPGLPVWQRNYYDHIIRDEEELAGIKEYIVQNPLRWAADHENPALWPPESQP